MDDLVAWLRQQLDEDERLAEMARLGASGVWKVSETDLDTAAVYYGDGPGDWPNSSDNGIVVYDEGAPTSEQTEHIARWDPARVLREVEAKRLIIDEHRGRETWGNIADEDDPAPICTTCARGSGHHESVPWPCPTLRLLAWPYSDRPGWREEWRP